MLLNLYFHVYLVSLHFIQVVDVFPSKLLQLSQE